MGRKIGIKRNGLRRIGWLAIAILVMCIGVFASRWYSFYKESKEENLEWFETQEKKFLTFAKLGIQQYEADPDLPGLPELAVFMKDVFGSSTATRILNVAKPGASEPLYDGLATMTDDGSGDQIFAYADTAVLGLRYPVYIQTTDEALKYAFPYMETLPDSGLSFCCIDPNQAKYESFSDVVTDLLQSDKVWAEKSGYTFKKCNVTFENDLSSDIVITRKNPDILYSYGPALRWYAIWIFVAGAAVLLLTWVAMMLIEKRAFTLQDKEETPETRESNLLEDAESLLSILRTAEQSVGPRPEFDRISDAIEEVKTSCQSVEQEIEIEKTSELSSTGGVFLRKSTTIIGAISLVLATSILLLTTVFLQNAFCDNAMSAKLHRQEYSLFGMVENTLDVLYSGTSPEFQYMAMGINQYLPTIKTDSDSSQTNLVFSFSSGPRSEKPVESKPFLIWFIQRIGEYGSIPAVFEDEILSEDSNEIFLGFTSLGSEDQTYDKYFTYSYSMVRPKEKVGENLRYLPVYCNENGDFKLFYEGKILSCYVQMNAGRVLQEDSDSSINFSSEFDKIFEKPDLDGNLSMETRVKWIRICNDILDGDKAPGCWVENYYYEVYEMSDVYYDGKPATYQYIEFEDGTKELKTLKRGVVTDVLLLLFLLLVVEIAWFLIRWRIKPDEETAEQTIGKEEKSDNAKEDTQSWASVLKSIEEAEAAIGTNGYLEDMRKKINS